MNIVNAKQNFPNAAALNQKEAFVSKVQKPVSDTNPFGDSFSQLNDNEIFGLEFDRIRHHGGLQTS